MGDPERLAGYRLQPGSPALGQGKRVENHAGIDFWGRPLHPTQVNLGAAGS
jgi:hypothetical protein